MAASYGQPSACQRAAAARQSPAICRAYGSAATTGAASNAPARRSKSASSPTNQRSFLAMASS